MINKFLKNINNKQSDVPLIAITGLCKNAGKTSLLNWLTSNLKLDNNFVLMTTGRDGEDFDQLGGHEKPKVEIPAGVIFVTHDGILSQFGDRVEILDKTKYKAGPYQVWVARALQPIKTEIIGPSTAKEQIELCEELKKYNPKMIFIDGSLDRKAITLHPEIDSILLVLSANYGTIQEIIIELERLLLLTKIRQTKVSDSICKKVSLISNDKVIYSWDSLLGNEEEFISKVKEITPDVIVIPGVITNSVWDKLQNTLVEFEGKVVVNHPYQLQLRKFELESIFDNVNIFCVNRFEIDGIAVNSYSVKGRHLDANKLREKIRMITKLPIIDSTEIII